MKGEKMQEAILDWNVPNWVTVTLMAAIGIAILFAAQKIVIQYRDRKAA